MRSMISLAGLAAAAIAAAGGNDTVGAAPRPGEGKRHRPTGPYSPKVPQTPADHERLRLAQLKRDRKAAKRAEIAQAGR